MKRQKYEKIDQKDRCAELSLDVQRRNPGSGDDSWTERIECKEYDAKSEHPTPEMLLIREAVKYLTPKQRAVWEYYSYDRLTQDEIAIKVKTSRQMVQQHIQAAEKRIAKWCKSNMGAYALLKSDFERAE